MWRNCCCLACPVLSLPRERKRDPPLQGRFFPSFSLRRAKGKCAPKKGEEEKEKERKEPFFRACCAAVGIYMPIRFSSLRFGEGFSQSVAKTRCAYNCGCRRHSNGIFPKKGFFSFCYKRPEYTSSLCLKGEEKGK